jgi:hypothetical protein
MNGTLEIVLKRLPDNDITTLGSLIFGKNQIISLEDDFDEIKEHGRTRIPSGRYEIKERFEGTFYQRMIKKYPFHRGMLHLQDVPNYKWILVHPGNKAEDTDGCIVTGSRKVDENNVSESTYAYLFFLGYVYAAFDRGERVFINIIDP